MLKKSLFLLVALIMMFSLSACGSPGGTTPTAEEEVTFPDPNLEAAVREAIGKPEGTIQISELEGLNMLFAHDRGITDLTGLEHCTSLTMLYLGNNQINDTSPLASLPKLGTLDLSNNQVSDLSSLASLPNIRILELGWNQISDISPLASLTSLISLGLNSRPGTNEISDISPLVSLTNLTQLQLWNNQISDIEPLLSLPHLQSVFILEGNPLSRESRDVYIPQLESRGVEVL